MDKYFVFTGGDGDIHADEVDAETLEKRLKEDYYGAEPYRKILTKVPDFQTWPEGGVLVIKGHVAPPVSVTKTTEWKAGD